MIQPQASRLDWIDVAKGIAIILVVIGHTWRGLFSAGIMPEAQFLVVDARIYAFHMPVFFLLSGFFYISTIKRFSTPDYVKRIAVRILWPMIIWTYIFLGTKLLAGSLSNNPVGIEDLLRLPIPGQAHLWFLWALCVISLVLFPLRFALQDGKVPPPLLWAVALLTVVPWFVPLPNAVTYWTSGAFSFIAFFYLGIILADQGFMRLATQKIGLGAAAIFIVVLIFWPVIDQTSLHMLGSLVLTLCFVAAVAGPLCARPFWGQSLLTLLGQASMVIYVAHTIFSATLREVLFVAGITDVSVHMILGIFIGLVGPLVFLACAKATKTRTILGV